MFGPGEGRRLQAEVVGSTVSDAPRILLIGLDPYLALLIRRDFPDGEVIAVDDSEDLDPLLRAAPDLVVIELSNPRLPQVRLHRDTFRVLGLARAGENRNVSGVDAIIVRPFLTSELRRTVGQLLGYEEPGRAGRRERWAVRLRTWLAPARFTAMLVSGLLVLTQPRPASSSLGLLVAGVLYALVRLRLLRGRPTGAWLDVALTLPLLLTTSGPISAYTPFAVVVAAGAGLMLGGVRGVGAASLLSLAAVPTLVTGIGHGKGLVDVIPFMLLFPAGALAGAQASRIWNSDARAAALAVMLEANRALTSLYRIARDIPRSLTLPSVAVAILEEASAALDAHAAVLFIDETGVLHEVGSVGLTEHLAVLAEREDPAVSGLTADEIREVWSATIPESIRAAAKEDVRWLVAPLRHAAAPIGSLLLAMDRPLQAVDRRALIQIVEEASLAVENARLFARVRDLSAGEERDRLARDLHDGVAQALTHVRLELEFLALHGDPSPEVLRAEVRRLARVAERGLSDVRATIADLRASSLPGGLSVALADHCRELRTMSGPDIRVHARTGARLAPDAEAEVFRIAREAIGNALRRAEVTEVAVDLSEVDGGLRLSVEDNGRALLPPKDRRSSRETVGVRVMRERAALLGARLEISRPSADKTRVVLTCPLGAAPHETTMAARSL